MLYFVVLVDLLPMSSCGELFDAVGLRGQNDRLLTVPDIISILTRIYTTMAADHPSLVSLPVCIDLALNWLLNVYDR